MTIRSRDDLKKWLREQQDAVSKDITIPIGKKFGIVSMCEKTLQAIAQWEANDLTDMSTDEMMKGK